VHGGLAFFFFGEVTLKTWYAIKAESDSEAVIDIFDYIGYWGVNARDFIGDLKALGDKITNIKVRINSDGGEVFDGIAIYNALRRHQANITVEIYGIAASIASIIAMAGNKVVMPANTFMFLHDPLALVVGDAEEMRDTADSLEKIAGALQSTYMVKSGKDEKTVKKWMNNDTWFSAQEALEAGLADEVTDAVKMAARIDFADRFKNAPKPLIDSLSASASPAATAPAAAPSPAPQPQASDGNLIEIVDIDANTLRAEAADISKLCNELGLPDMAADFFKSGARLADVQKRFANSTEIRNRCAAAGMPERAARYIQAALDPEEVSKNLLAIKAALDTADIDNKQRDDRKDKPVVEQKPFDPSAINKRYRDREKNFGRKL